MDISLATVIAGEAHEFMIEDVDTSQITAVPIANTATSN